MARIPYQPAAQVAPAGTPAQNPRKVSALEGFDKLSKGITKLAGAIGGQMDAGVSAYEKRVEESRQKALEAEATEGETEWNKYRTHRYYGRTASGKGAAFDAAEAAFNEEPNELPGYFNLKGDEAFKAGPETYEAIEKKRNEIASEMTDEDARERFLARTASDLDRDYAQIVEHRAKQRQLADLATLEAREEAGLEAVRANPNNLTEVERQTQALEEPIAKLGLSDEDKQARVRAWRQKVAAAQVVGQLNRGDWQSAEITLKNKREAIGDGASAKLDEQIRKVKGDSVAELKAQSIVEGVTGRSGRVDGERARELVDQVPPGAERDEVRQRVHARLVEAEQQYRRTTEEITRRAEAAYNEVGWSRMPVQLKDELNERNPAKYRQLRDEAEQRWKRLNADRDDTRRETREANKVLLNEFLALSPEERANTRVDAFVAKFKEENPDLPIDRAGISALQPKQRAAIDAVTRGQAVHEEAFVRDAKANAQGLVKGKQELKVYEAEATLAFHDFVAEKKRPPNAEESTKLIGALRVKRATKPGVIYGFNEEYEFQRRARERQKTAGSMVLPTLDFTGDELGGGAATSPPATAPAASPPASAAQVPAAERAKIEAALRKKGYQVTEEAVQALFRKVHGG